MTPSGATATMATKKRPRGRPKAAKPMKSIVSLKGTEELAVWLDGLTLHSESGTQTNTLRRALKAFAKGQGYEREMPER